MTQNASLSPKAEANAERFPIGSIARYTLDTLTIIVKIREHHPEGAWIRVTGHGLTDVNWGEFICDESQLEPLSDRREIAFHKDGLVGFEW